MKTITARLARFSSVRFSSGRRHRRLWTGAPARGAWPLAFARAVTATVAAVAAVACGPAHAQPAAAPAPAATPVVKPALKPARPACQGVDLFSDDFSKLPPGWLTKPVGTLNAAIQEYHYLPHRGVPLGPWASAICHLDAWVAGDEEGNTYLEQATVADLPVFAVPTFLTGDPEWQDVTIDVKVKPLSLAHFAGIAFRYQTNKQHYLFVLAGGNEARLLLRGPIDKAYREADWRTIAVKPFPYEANKKYYKLRVENEGPTIRGFVDGKLILEATGAELPGGKVALVASAPARFQDVHVSACSDVKEAIEERIKQREAELTRLRAENPQPKVWKKFTTPKFGAGRNARFGDLDGDGQIDMLIAQNIPRIKGDTFDAISALTAVTLDGRVIWQSGRSDPRNGLLTNDTPFQINDVDGDGQNDVLLIRDFKLQLLDGKNGNVKRWVWMPNMKANAPTRPYETYSGDAIIFANLTGKKGRRDFLLKDRYRHIWAYSSDLTLLWEGDEDTGHYPYPIDIDGDGKDELFVGHGMWDHKGKRLWSRAGELKDHVDSVAVGNFTGNPKAPPRVYWATSDEGFIMLDLKGKILKHTIVGHTQTGAIGKFRPDLPGLQMATTNFWRNPGIVSVFDADGNLLTQGEPIHTGSVTLPVNWRGDGQEFILLSGNKTEGGMIDGKLRRVVMFPDDGHPDLTAAVLDVVGDPRDEIFLWDESSVWIYTQDDKGDKAGTPDKAAASDKASKPAKAPTKIYAPIRGPLYNDSNYRSHVSLPAWKPVAAKPRP
jgi:rhamnogalacturonan endolyase